jgi:murein DD-endopeptidase MepM/ murein hydrolase activator NlpD
MRLPLLLLVLGLPALSAEEERPALSIQPGTARPGDPVLITVRGLAGPPTASFGGRPLRFYPVPDGFQALTALPVEQPVGALEVKVTGPTKDKPLELAGSLEVVAPGWPERTLNVAGKYIKPPPEVTARIEADQAAFAAAFSQPFVPPLFTRDFAWPRKDRITAPYGDLRTFNGKKQSQHYGTDIDGDTGAPVDAANDGVVVMTRDNYSAGQTVLLHHGASLYTAYFHLSKIQVKKGQRVKQGQRLGKVGGTGRVTGPHLHWGVKVEGSWVDGETLLKLKFF